MGCCWYCKRFMYDMWDKDRHKTAWFIDEVHCKSCMERIDVCASCMAIVRKHPQEKPAAHGYCPQTCHRCGAKDPGFFMDNEKAGIKIWLQHIHCKRCRIGRICCWKCFDHILVQKDDSRFKSEPCPHRITRWVRPDPNACWKCHYDTQNQKDHEPLVPDTSGSCPHHIWRWVRESSKADKK